MVSKILENIFSNFLKKEHRDYMKLYGKLESRKSIFAEHFLQDKRD
jgi:hypothetical protein